MCLCLYRSEIDDDNLKLVLSVFKLQAGQEKNWIFFWKFIFFGSLLKHVIYYCIEVKKKRKKYIKNWGMLWAGNLSKDLIFFVCYFSFLACRDGEKKNLFFPKKKYKRIRTSLLKWNLLWLCCATCKVPHHLWRTKKDQDTGWYLIYE